VRFPRIGEFVFKGVGLRAITPKPPWTAAAASALERFLQLAGDFVGRGLHRALHDLGGPGQRLVQPLFDGRLADRDEPGLAGGELLSG
jgi:hypothetical protein